MKIPINMANRCACWAADGFDLAAHILDDDCPGLSHLGDFDTTWREGAIPHKGGRDSYPYFIPANPEYGAQDYARLCDYGNGWCAVGVCVTASAKGIELGRASLWGIDSDSGGDYFADVAEELAAEALASAEAKLKELQAI